MSNYQKSDADKKAAAEKRKEALKDYVEVNVRIGQFWDKFPNGRLATSIHSWVDHIVVVKAEAYRNIEDAVPAATGYAYENETNGQINRTSALENAETSAVGRALGILGFEIKKSVASKEEVENAIRQQESKQVSESDQMNQAKQLYQQGKGSLDGFEEWVSKKKAEGHSMKAIVVTLQDLIKKSEEQSDAQ